MVMMRYILKKLKVVIKLRTRTDYYAKTLIDILSEGLDVEILLTNAFECAIGRLIELSTDFEKGLSGL